MNLNVKKDTIWEQKIFIEEQIENMRKCFNTEIEIEYLNEKCYLFMEDSNIFNLLEIKMIGFQTKNRVRLKDKITLEMIDD